MTSNDVAKLAGEIIGSWLIVGFVLFGLFSLLLPLMVLSIASSLRGIRRELSTLNETVQQRLIGR
jgi:ABC-type spermidine/putrescine transport system permease subunit I